MPSLKSNYIRTQITSQCFRYEFELISSKIIDPRYYHEIEGYFLSLNALAVFSYPFVYSIEEMPELKSFNFMLSNGQKTQVVVLGNNTVTLNSKEVAVEIHRQMMKGTNFLYSENLQIVLNPFEEKKLNFFTAVMPGFSISTETTNDCVGFYLVPIEAKITEFHSLSSLHEHSIILDYNSGTFYQKSSIVRYDKSKQILHFRTGEQLSRDSLKSLEILPVTGYELALKVASYFKRIRETQKLKEFITKWEIKFDSRFLQVPYTFFPVSHILSGNRQQRSLGQVIGSISSYNFQYNFKKLFGNITFDDSLRGTIYFLLPQLYTQPMEEPIQLQGQVIDFYAQLVQAEEEFMLPVIAEFENMQARMQMGDCRIVVMRYEVFPGWVNGEQRTLKQVGDIVEKESQQPGDKIFVLDNVEELLRQERELQLGSKLVSGESQNSLPVHKLLANFFVQNGVYYHIINAVDNEFRKAADVIALKSFATIFTKLRLNPWKIKQIPFGTKPLMTFSLHVKLETTGSVVLTIVGTLNAFLSKYTCLVVTCTGEEYNKAISRGVIEAMEKFRSIHTVYPKRAMIFRTGDFTQHCEDQFREVENQLIQKYSCKPTYILLNADSPLRVYNQIDYNYISKDTVKPTQLLCQVKYNNERYIQLEFDWPLYKVNILGDDPLEHNFEEKVVELMTKLCFTYQIMTEMKFGRGLGFIGYGEKLYTWAKEFTDIKGMENHLKEGLLMFL